MLRAARASGVRIHGVFGSVARGEDGPDSDIDLLVDLPPGLGLFGVARLQRELQQILDARVELIPAADLKPGVRPAAVADLVPL